MQTRDFKMWGGARATMGILSGKERISMRDFLSAKSASKKARICRVGQAGLFSFISSDSIGSELCSL